MTRYADATNTIDEKNYLGELFLVGQNKTPFLNMIGGIDGSRTKVTRSFEFPVSQPWSLENPSQPAITELASISGATPTSVGRGQETNTVQIFQEAVSVSYAKQSEYGALAGLSAIGDQPVKDELAFQKLARLKQLALDYNYSILNGVYAAKGASTAAKTRGIITASTTNAVAADNAKFSKALLNALMKEMADNGAALENMVLFCNSFNKQVITDVFGYAPESRTVGGANIQQILTDFCPVGVVYEPNVPADTILVADMNFISPVVCPVGDKTVFYEELAKTGAAENGQMYGQLGIDYGAKENHGVITGLATA